MALNLTEEEGARLWKACQAQHDDMLRGIKLDIEVEIIFETIQEEIEKGVCTLAEYEELYGCR